LKRKAGELQFSPRQALFSMFLCIIYCGFTVFCTPATAEQERCKVYCVKID